MGLLKTYTISTDVTGGAINLNRLSGEIESSGDVVNFEGIIHPKGSDTFELYGDSFTEANVDTTVLNHLTESLAELKARRYGEIDYKTVTLIASGFTYDGKTFSLSINAQANWNNLKHDKATFTFPKDISTIDNDKYSIAEANVDAFWGAGKDAIDGDGTTTGHLTTGRNLKKSVFDAVDKAAVDLVVDNR